MKTQTKVAKAPVRRSSVPPSQTVRRSPVTETRQLLGNARQDAAVLAPSTLPMPKLPPVQAPPQFNFYENFAIALSLRTMPAPAKLASFYLLVRNGGPWDYKQAFKKESGLGQAFASKGQVAAEYRHIVEPGDEIKNPYVEFGNWHFGFMGAVAGIPAEVLLRGAGWAQRRAKTSRKEWSHPGLGGKPPFGDDPADQRLIQQGIKDFNEFRWSDPSKSESIHPTLEVGRIDDAAEREADAMADRVMLMRDGTTCCSACAAGSCTQHAEIERGQAKHLRRKASGSSDGGLAVPSELEPQVRRATSGGEALPQTVRAFFEPRFGKDLSQVRVHRDADAAASASALGAKAYALGSHIAFAEGQYRPDSTTGRRLMAHELAHVVQQGGIVRRADCTKKTDEGAIVVSHTVRGKKIGKPGEEAVITVKFSCGLRSLVSEIVDDNGKAIKTDVFDRKSKSSLRAGTLTLNWDGRKFYDEVGTYMVDDGTYRHQIRKVAYAPGSKTDLLAAGGAVLSTSPPITVNARAGISAGPAKRESRHLFGAKGKKLKDNVRTVADAMNGEASGTSDVEKSAVAWAIRNQMARINSYDAAKAQTAFNFVTAPSTAAERKLAEEILAQNLAKDPTQGAIKWYSPKSMPPHKGSCDKGAACGGGVVALATDPKRSSYAPAYHKHMTYVALQGVKEWNFRFYKL